MDMENEIVKINGDDPCPCGSKKPFKDCCIGKGHTYASFGYGEHKFVLNLDETNKNVTDLLHFTFDNIVTFQNKGLVIEKEKALTTLKVVYEMIATTLEPFLRNSSCKKGCHECCHYLVAASAIEAELIRRYVKENYDHEHRLSILSKIDKTAVYYPHPVDIREGFPDEVRSLYNDRHIPCAFLSKAGDCMVYEARPTICRTHMMLSGAENCKADGPFAKYEAYYFPQLFMAIQLLSGLVWEDIEHKKHIGHWFLDEFRF